MNLRAAAANVIYEVMANGRSLSDCLPDVIAKLPDTRDQALLQAMCYGVCRWYWRLNALLALLLEKPLKVKDQDIHALLLIGLYQLSEMRVPAHAAVAETVAAIHALKKDWAKNLVNAVLRNYQRRTSELNEKVLQQAVARYSHPTWLIENVKKAWPTDWESILTANNQHPPFALRVNLSRISREEYLSKLLSKNIAAQVIPETRAGIVLEQAMDAKKLPGFEVGEVSVQDGAAQLAAELLQLAQHQYVLDACAAPGGKTTHILELQGDVELVAIDQNDKRLSTVQENLARLQFHATCQHADVAAVKQWWDGRLFDRILLDAPCSASGVIRRHPDIKLLRRGADIAKLGEEQARLLNAVWPLLVADGLLVYATCSIFPEENHLILQNFLATHADAKEEKIISTWGKDCVIGKQILPGIGGMDGFYFGCLRKSAVIPA